MSDNKQLLSLYVTNNARKHQQMLDELRAVLEKYYPGVYEVELIDILDDMESAMSAEVYATPTLIKNHSGKEERVVGEISEIIKTLLLIGVIEDTK
jgi:circadian clock protein KaiB